MNDMKDTGFKSYLNDEVEIETISLNDSVALKLLPGETLVTEANKVMLFGTLSDQKQGILGTLSVTTFKLSFIDGNERQNVDGDAANEHCYQQNLLLGIYDVCLSSIETIYQIGDRRKKLMPGTNVSGKIKGLAIVCKNMRTFEFSFKFADKDKGKSIANTILHHAFPKRHSLLFAYEYSEEYYNTMNSEIRLFRRPQDWKREMERTGCKNWRISTGNQSFHLSSCLPQVLIVPSSVTDDQLNKAVGHFRNQYCPVWVWTNKDGNDLVRMADLLPTITDRTQENILLENVRKCHRAKVQPKVMDLSKDCPTIRDVQHSYQRLRELCIPDSIRTFKTQDWKLYSLLDASKWLTHISTCLSIAKQVCEYLRTSTVVLQEGNGTDMNCLISSLIQLLMDPHWRTVNGFQSLIQKEWIALGHPFASRLGHVHNGDGSEISPIFLLFLDCVWQLLRQFPTAFQFTETYLTTLWDSAHISVFETFIFNSEHDRYLAETDRNNHIILRSVWDWKEQFTDKDIVFFCNPLYDDCYKSVLNPLAAVPFLDLWVQCYFRWLPPLEIPSGGHPQVDLHCRALATEIHLLRQKLLADGDVGANVSLTSEENLKLRHKVNSFFPFSHNTGKISEIFAANNSILADGGLDTQSILNNPEYKL